MDVIELVKKDHDRVEELFARFRGGGGLTGLVRRVAGTVTPRERRSAVTGICDELDVHARVEEEILYPAIRALGDTELARLVDESLREHAQVKNQVAQLRTHPDGEDLETRVSELESNVQHHVNEEENEMLPRVEEMMPEARRAELGRRMQTRKRALAPRTKRTKRRTAPAGRRASSRKRATATARARGTKKSRTTKSRTTRGKAKKRRAQ